MFYFLGPTLAEQGANLLVTVAVWPRYPSERFEEVTKENASQARCWHLVSNQVGKVGDLQDYGHSRIVDPNGKVIADTGQKEGMVIEETDLLIDTTLATR